MQKEYTLEVGGRTLTASFPNWAEQTNGSALVRYGDTVVLATTVMGKSPREGIDYFPLMVEYQEKFYAAGRIRGSRFVKREGRPSDDAILTGRMIDRSLRPRFDQRTRNDVQVTVSVLSVDGMNDPDIPSFIAASLSLLVSDIPWNGPVSAVRVGRIDGNWTLNPTTDLTPKTDVEVIVASTEDRINMLEAGASQVSEEEIAEAIEFGHRANASIIEFQKNIQKEIGRTKSPVIILEPDEALVQEVREFTKNKLEAALFQEFKQERMEAVTALHHAFAGELKLKYPDDKMRRETALALFEEEINRLVHEKALRGIRVDGRKPDELRSISANVGFLPRTHGSGLFMRGLTHVLSVCTLGAPGDAQIMEEMTGEYTKRFMLHYNFPGFSVGEPTPNRGPGRREIGHGALAERALEAVIPNVEDFPYTIRIVSETLSSNGSSSQGSATSASLALMDAGVPIKAAVAGIAIGLMMGSDGSAQVLTDIQGPEDHHGDMDFKVAGTKNGVTAIQMDVKIEGITVDILKEALRHGKKARMKILATVSEAIEEPRATLSPYAPLVQVLKINPSKIRLVIGTGGKTINEIIAETNTKIDIEDDGTVFVTAQNQTDGKRAIERIQNLTHETKIGELFQAKVVKIAEFGAFVEYLPGQEGLVHVSELASTYVKSVEDIVKVGDIIPVKVVKIDEQGKVGLSRKQAM
ncbi:MAG: polyribonucleotide nucleotidyltransferase [Candidatus Spechtbacteria bacterium]|nr:polyribonucleotide nucleotidyltransferase [Candidatus Spechtbacteria bacterium]